MAQKSQHEQLIDLFAKLGHDLKLPDPDIERIIEHHRKNLEAVEKSARAAGAGASSIASRQREMFQEMLDQITKMAHDYRVTQPQEAMAMQLDFARRSFEMAMRNTQEMAQLVARSGDETFDILRQRIKDGMAEIQQGAPRKR